MIQISKSQILDFNPTNIAHIVCDGVKIYLWCVDGKVYVADV